MSGHSKWSKIKHQKGIKDAKRGKLFSQLAKEIMVASRNGSDPETNYPLKLVVQKAKAEGLPKENIDRAILKGSGGGEGSMLEEAIYEGFGPAGVGVIVKVLTDNKNRALQEIRLSFDKNGGNMANSNSVMFNFDHIGEIIIPNIKQTENLEETLINLDVKNYEFSEDGLIVYTEIKDLFTVQSELEKQNLKIDSAEISYLPKSTISLKDEQREKLEKLVERLEDLDDVSGVWENSD